jgi:hypothetical protein
VRGVYRKTGRKMVRKKGTGKWGHEGSKKGRTKLRRKAQKDGKNGGQKERNRDVKSKTNAPL